MVLLEVKVVNLRLRGGVAAVLTDVDLTGGGVILKYHFMFYKNILPLISSAYIRIGEQLHEPLSSDFPANISE